MSSSCCFWNRKQIDQCRLDYFEEECRGALQRAIDYGYYRSRRLLRTQLKMHVEPCMPVKDVVGLIGSYLETLVTTDFEAYFFCYLWHMQVLRNEKLYIPLFQCIFEYNDWTRNWLLQQQGIHTADRMVSMIRGQYSSSTPCVYFICKFMGRCQDRVRHTVMWNRIQDLWRTISIDFL